MPSYRGKRVYRSSHNNYSPPKPFTSQEWGNPVYENPSPRTPEYVENDAIRQNHRLDQSVTNEHYNARVYGLLGWPTATFTQRGGWNSPT